MIAGCKWQQPAWQRYNLAKVVCPAKTAFRRGAAQGIFIMRKLSKCLLMAVLVCSPALLSADTVVEEIIARVNNSIITRTEYQHSRDQLKQEAEQQDPGSGDKAYAERQKDVLRDLIDQQLLLEKGKDLDITADTELVKRLDEMRKEMKLDSMDDLEKAAQSQGVSFEDFKQNLRNQIITQQVISKEVGSKLSMAKDEVQKYYQAHLRRRCNSPEEMRAGRNFDFYGQKARSRMRRGGAGGAGAKAEGRCASG